MYKKIIGVLEKYSHGDRFKWSGTTTLRCTLWHLNIACQLLCEDASVVYIIDKDYSQIALHVAAENGHVSIMREILLHRPDTCSVVNKFGQNILHLGIKNNQKEVVEYIIKECPVISSLINQKDVDGNTPSHLMALPDCYFPQLIQHDMVDKGALNNENLTPLVSNLHTYAAN